MADPTPYVPSYSFSGWQAVNPSKPLPGASLDNELANVSAAVAGLVDSVKDVRRSDGQVANQSIGADQLKPELLLPGMGDVPPETVRAAVALGLTRADIPATSIPFASFTVDGYSTHGDAGAGALYVSGTGVGPMAIQDKDGRWFELSYGDAGCAVPLGRFGSPAIGNDWTLVMETALASGEPILVPVGTHNVEQIVFGTNATILGQHQRLSILKLADGANTHVLQTAGVDALIGTDPTSVAPYDVTIHNLAIDGNRTNNTAGCGIKAFARRLHLSRLNFYSIPEDMVYTDYSDSASGPITGAGMLGMESIFRDIWGDFIGGYGVRMGGPHDSALENIHVIHASQNASNTYDAFYFGPGMTARARNLHCYNSGGAYGIQRYGLLDEAGYLDITTSHFEGSGTANAYLKAVSSILTDCSFYATRDAARNLIIGAPKVFVSGRLLPAASGSTTQPVGLTMGLSGDFPAECIVELQVAGQEAGSLDLTHSAGKNNITLRGSQGGSNPVLIGSAPATDAIDVLVDGTRYARNGNVGNANVAAGGTNASDATALPYRVNRITSAAGNFGVKLPDSVQFVGEAAGIVVVNTTASIIKVYPAGSDFIDNAGSGYVPVPVGKSATFSCSVATAWCAVVSA